MRHQCHQYNNGLAKNMCWPNHESCDINAVQLRHHGNSPDEHLPALHRHVVAIDPCRWNWIFRALVLSKPWGPCFKGILENWRPKGPTCCYSFAVFFFSASLAGSFKLLHCTKRLPKTPRRHRVQIFVCLRLWLLRFQVMSRTHRSESLE